MSYFVVDGGYSLSGELRPAGNKNEALPVLAATVLSKKPVLIKNVPDIKDVNVMLSIIEELGGVVEKRESHEFLIDCSGIGTTDLPVSLFAKLRASLTLIGPMLSRFGGITCPLPGGDKIGRRRIDTHLQVMEGLGAEILFHEEDDKISFTAPKGGLRGAEIILDEPSVTATENAVMAASLAKGETVIYNAACEPHVQGLCAFLRGMGASIEGAGTNRIKVKGAEELGSCEYTIQYDYIEAGSFMGLAAVTGSELLLKDIFSGGGHEFRVISRGFERIGLSYERVGDDLHIPGGQELRITPDFRGGIPTISDGPWPLFPADLTSVMIVAASKAHGSVIVHEKMFESRMFFVDKLKYMGAQIVLCDPHRVVCAGPSELYGNEVVSPDIRAGISLLIAALGARGRSVIHNIMQIDRGYENIDGRLNGIGAKIKRVEEKD